MDDPIFLYLALVPVLGISAQIMAWWLRVPSILLLLTFGVCLGLWLNPDKIIAEASGNETIGTRLVFPIVSISVGVILFEGGLTLKLHELRESVGPAIVRLCTIGVIISWVLTTLLASWLLDLHYSLAVLLGAVLVVTGPTVIAPLLRHIRPNRKIGSVIKWEGIVIDPIGAILAVLVFEHFFHSSGHDSETAAWFSPLVGILTTMAIGLSVASITGLVLVQFVKRYWVPDYLDGVFFLAAAVGAFAVSNMLMHETGLVTVTLLGIYLANQKQISIEHVMEFKEHLSVFLISCLFIILGSRLDLAIMGEVGWRGAAFVALMILLVRPISVFGAMIGSRLTRREKVFLAFLAPRGIVAAAVVSVFSLRILATSHDPVIVAGANLLVPATFMLIVGTVAVYGLAAAPLARRLGLADANPQGILFAGADPWVRDIAETVKEAGFAVVVVDTNFRNISATRMLGITAYCKSILADYVRNRVNLTGIGKLFALTKNDAVNEMAVREYSHMFGSANVFRLRAKDAEKGARSKIGQVSHGRTIFDEEWDEQRLVKAYRDGYRAKVTKLSEEFTFDDFKAEYDHDFLLLMTISDKDIIDVNTIEDKLQPAADDTVIALVQANVTATTN